MKNTTKKLFNKVASLALAAMMVLSVFCVSTPTEVSAADKSFKSTGKSSVTITDEQCTTITEELTWIKFKAKNDGYLKITATNASSVASYTAGAWQLYDKNKKISVSPAHKYNTNYTDSYFYTDVYGVKKGVTYYLAVNSYAGVKIKASFTKVADKSGSTKAKALSVKKGKSATGLIRVGDKNSDWYKFTLTKKQLLTITVTPYLNDAITVKIVGPSISGSATITNDYYGEKYPFRIVDKYTQQPIKASTGTYYIQVKSAKKTTSGYYKISWK